VAAARGNAAIGVDLGGTNIVAALVQDGVVQAEHKIETPDAGPEAAIARIAGLIDDLDSKGNLPVGLGAPGQVNQNGQLLSKANLPGWEPPVPLAEMLASACNRSNVTVGNDVNVAALAEQQHGAGRDCADVMVVFVGTGVGSGLILDGSLRTGPRGLAGEFGHIVVGLGDRICGCGGVDHLEAYAGRRCMSATARSWHAIGRESQLIHDGGKRSIKSRVYEAAVENGDEVALELVATAAEALGRGVATVVSLVDIERVVIGGGLGERLGAPFMAQIEASYREARFASAPVEIVPAALGDHAGAIGAALLALST
jgi:glucokinase